MGKNCTAAALHPHHLRRVPTGVKAKIHNAGTAPQIKDDP